MARTTGRRRKRSLELRLALLEARVERIEAERAGRSEPTGKGSCCDDLIGCLDDCVDDVAALRKKVRNARR